MTHPRFLYSANYLSASFEIRREILSPVLAGQISPPRVHDKFTNRRIILSGPRGAERSPLQGIPAPRCGARFRSSCLVTRTRPRPRPHLHPQYFTSYRTRTKCELVFGLSMSENPQGEAQPCLTVPWGSDQLPPHCCTGHRVRAAFG
jgi:hypothetical protein